MEQQSEKRISVSPLKNKKKAIELSVKLEESMEQVQEEDNVEEMWQEWKKSIMETTKAVLKEEQRKEKKEVWMTDEILEMMAGRMTEIVMNTEQ